VIKVTISRAAVCDGLDVYRRESVKQESCFSTRCHIADRVNLLLASKEARQIAIESLSGVIPCDPPGTQYPQPDLRLIRFNPSKDIIYLHNFDELFRFDYRCDLIRRDAFQAAFKDIQSILIPARSLKCRDELDIWNFNLFLNLKVVNGRMQSIRQITPAGYELVKLSTGSDPARPTQISVEDGAPSSANCHFNMLPYYEHAKKLKQYIAAEVPPQISGCQFDGIEKAESGPRLQVAGVY